jgi:hypothetical protein
MASYCYYDSSGVLKEFVNTIVSRKGDDGNVVYFYFDSVTPVNNGVKIFWKRSDGYGSFYAGLATATVQVPYDKNRTLKYFSYYTDYVCYKLTLGVEALALSGLLILTPNITTQVTDENTTKTKSYGVYNVTVEDNNVALDESMSLSNFYYLLSLIGTDYNGFVTIATDQTITGIKTFTNPIIFDTGASPQFEIGNINFTFNLSSTTQTAHTIANIDDIDVKLGDPISMSWDSSK